MRNFSKLLVNPSRYIVRKTIDRRCFKIISYHSGATNELTCNDKEHSGSTPSDSKNDRQHNESTSYGSKKSNLVDKIAVITGGTSPYGLVCARELLKCGAKGVMLVDHDEKEGEVKLTQLCKDCGSDKVAFIRADLKNALLLRNAFHNTKEHFGEINLTMNIVEQSENSQWTEEIDKNIRGIVRSTLLGYEFMDVHKGGTGGTICNILISPSLTDNNDLCPILVATRNYMVSFGKAMSSKFNKTTGIKVITCFAESSSLATTALSSQEKAQRESLSKMLEHSAPGSVWTLYFIKRKK